MRISFIVATDLEGVIGKDGGLPWRLPSDLRRFRRLTLGKPIIMGRKTHESIGKALDGRTNIVLTTQADYQAEGCQITHSARDAFECAEGAEEVMVIGGAAVYALLLPRTTRIYLTEVQGTFSGDTRFPPFERAEWREIEREEHSADEKNPHASVFSILERI